MDDKATRNKVVHNVGDNEHTNAVYDQAEKPKGDDVYGESDDLEDGANEQIDEGKHNAHHDCHGITLYHYRLDGGKQDIEQQRRQIYSQAVEKKGDEMFHKRMITFFSKNTQDVTE